MTKAFYIAFGRAFSQSHGYDYEVSPYAILDENLGTITDLLGNVIEEEF